jgi:hypothetical protein
MSKAFFGIGFACVAAMATGWNSLGLRDTINPPHPVAGLDANDTSASASLLGQFRTNTSSWLWLRTDLYLHNGVELRPLTDSERKAGQTGVGSADKDLSAALNEDSVVSAIPSPDKDFRGWVGDLERATSPYKDMHEHTHNDPEQSIPLFRLMTWIDPNFIEGWTVGATVIERERTDYGTNKALQFLNEGLANNPESISILDDIAFVYITRKKDKDAAITYLERARLSGLKHRKTLPDDELEDFTQVYRWLGLCYRDTNQPGKMNQVLAEGHALFPDDAVINMLNDQPPAILTEYGRKQWLKKHEDAARQETTKTGAEAHDIH